jgi:hypothetical protein
MKWYEYIITNWAQVSVLLAILGYILKAILDYRYKKKEIAFSYFAKEKMNSAVLFLQEYSAMAFHLASSFTIPDIREKVRDGEFTDNTIFPQLGLFLKSYGQLLLFFKEKDIADCTKIMNNLQPVIDDYVITAKTFARSKIDLGKFQLSHNTMMKVLEDNNILIRIFCEKCKIEFVR